MDDELEAYLDPASVRHPLLEYSQSPAEVEEGRTLLRCQILTVEPPDKMAAAEAIVRWVHRHLRPGLSLGRLGCGTSIRGILHRGIANCVGHSAVVCFLLRAQGIPARLISEQLYTAFDPLAVPLALLPSARVAVGPFLMGHVWVELYVDDRWLPADAELGIFGLDEWVATRLARSNRIAAESAGLRLPLGLWHFPLLIKIIDHQGKRADVISQRYLIDAVRERVSEADSPSALQVWETGVRYFNELFDWTHPLAALRFALQRPRLQRMHRALRTLLSR